MRSLKIHIRFELIARAICWHQCRRIPGLTLCPRFVNVGYTDHEAITLHTTTLRGTLGVITQ